MIIVHTSQKERQCQSWYLFLYCWDHLFFLSFRAAFQYGVKMNDGRKTRRYPKGGDEKAKLDREWQKISAIISKRQGGSDLSG